MFVFAVLGLVMLMLPKVEVNFCDGQNLRRIIGVWFSSGSGGTVIVTGVRFHTASETSLP